MSAVLLYFQPLYIFQSHKPILLQLLNLTSQTNIPHYNKTGTQQNYVISLQPNIHIDISIIK